MTYRQEETAMMLTMNELIRLEVSGRGISEYLETIKFIRKALYFLNEKETEEAKKWITLGAVVRCEEILSRHSNLRELKTFKTFYSPHALLREIASKGGADYCKDKQIQAAINGVTVKSYLDRIVTLTSVINMFIPNRFTPAERREIRLGTTTNTLNIRFKSAQQYLREFREAI